jgi:hypothetical protein
VLYALLVFLMVGCGQEAKRGKQSFQISNGYFTGILHDNESNRERQGSGFNPLTHYLYPKQNLFHDDAVGLNFEHIMNGTAKDADICMFTPRRDVCSVQRQSEYSASIIHKAENSTWNMDSEITYILSGKNSIDIEFKVTLRKNRFPLDYVAFMWASYLNCTFDRRIYFVGRNNGEEDWVAFGEDTEDGFETGTIAYHGVDHLPYEKATKTLNIIESPTKKFIHPFYYGLVHGSGRIDCQEDTMVYIMMFDQKETIRFAMWNFIKDSDGIPDTHSPAWDWQFVIREPQINREYGYRARVVYKPYIGRDDVKEEYLRWVSGLR